MPIKPHHINLEYSFNDGRYMYFEGINTWALNEKHGWSVKYWNMVPMMELPDKLVSHINIYDENWHDMVLIGFLPTVVDVPICAVVPVLICIPVVPPEDVTSSPPPWVVPPDEVDLGVPVVPVPSVSTELSVVRYSSVGCTSSTADLQSYVSRSLLSCSVPSI